MTRKILRPWTLTGLAVVVGAAVTACGSGSPASTRSDGTTSGAATDGGTLDAQVMPRGSGNGVADAAAASEDSGSDARGDAQESGVGTPDAAGQTVDGSVQSAWGSPVVIADLSTEVDPEALSVNETTAYWSEVYPTCVITVPLTGGPLSAFVCNAVTPVLGANALYFTDVTNDSQFLLRQPLSGGMATTLLAKPAGAFTLSPDGQSLYALDPDTGTLSKIALASGAVTTVAANLFASIDDGTNGITGLVVDSTNAYWSIYGTANLTTSPPTKNSDGLIMSAPLAGGGAVLLASGQTAPVALSVDGSNVYWTNNGTTNYNQRQGTAGAPTADGSVMSVPLAGGPITAMVTGLSGPVSAALDSQNVYVADAFGSILAVPLAGGPVATLYVAGKQGNEMLGTVVVNAGGLYWIDGLAAGQRLLHLPRQ